MTANLDELSKHLPTELSVVQGAQLEGSINFSGWTPTMFRRVRLVASDAYFPLWFDPRVTEHSTSSLLLLGHSKHHPLCEAAQQAQPTLWLQMCILAGCDYLASPSRMGLKTAYRIVRHARSIYDVCIRDIFDTVEPGSRAPTLMSNCSDPDRFARPCQLKGISYQTTTYRTLSRFEMDLSTPLAVHYTCSLHLPVNLTTHALSAGGTPEAYFGCVG
jgi:hypothetical protein